MVRVLRICLISVIATATLWTSPALGKSPEPASPAWIDWTQHWRAQALVNREMLNKQRRLSSLPGVPRPAAPPPLEAPDRAWCNSGRAFKHDAIRWHSAYVEPTHGSTVAIGRAMAAQRGWTGAQWTALYHLWNHESGWRVNATNGSTWGIPQALPGSKMAVCGADWRTNPVTQIRWGLGYIAGRYSSPTIALAHFYAHNWY